MAQKPKYIIRSKSPKEYQVQVMTLLPGGIYQAYRPIKGEDGTPLLFTSNRAARLHIERLQAARP